MKESYRTKRDFYKAQAELERGAKLKAQQELEALKQQILRESEEKKKRYEATVYCSNCMRVSNVLIYPGSKILEGSCVICRVVSSPLKQTLFPVYYYPGQIKLC